MKKIKMMLLSLAILAVVGGALAFNVRNTKKYCTSTYDGGSTPPETCSILTTSTTVNAIDLFWTTTPVTPGGVATCTEAGTFLTCFTSTSLIKD